MKIDAIFRNGRIRTMDPSRPTARDLGVLHGRIVGLDDELQGVSANAEYDLGGAPVLPGFNDVHHHLSMRGQRARGVDLRAGSVSTMDELYAAVGRACAETPQAEWVYGSGYNQRLLGGEHPTADRLDRVSHGRAVWLEHVSGHMGVANTAAFERMGFTDRRGLPEIAGGEIPLDDQGRALGLLLERAVDLATHKYKPLPVDDIVENIRVASLLAVSEGTTSTTEPGVGTITGIGNSPLDLHAYARAKEEGALLHRATVMPYITTLHEIEGRDGSLGWGLDLGLRTGVGDEWVQIGPVKVLTDGSLIGRSAALTSCYAGEESSGFMAWDVAELSTILDGAYRAGFRLALHAIGDRSVGHALDILHAVQARHPNGPGRNRIEHFGVASDEQVAKAAELGIVPVPQGRFITELGDGMAEALGPDRVSRCYRMRSLLDAGLVVPGSSDTPVVEGSAILGIHDLVNRRTASGAPFAPEERVSVSEAVHAYTVGSAYAGAQEHERGQLSNGYFADFVALSDDLMHVADDAIDRVTVGATVVGGMVRFDSGVF